MQPMSKRENRPVALVTGAGVRLGRACALALARDGFSVAAHCRRSRREASALVRDIRATGADAWLLTADLTRPGAGTRLFDAALRAAGRLDLVVNSASTYEPSEIATVARADIVRNLDLHVVPALELGQCLARRTRDAQVVNLLDTRIVCAGAAGHAAYLLSKQSLWNLTRMMAVAFAPRVRVNAIAPGAVLPPDGTRPAYLRKLARANPMGRIGSADDVVRALLYLVHAPFVTGQVLFVDGGYHLRGNLHA
jgi:NAD(P)-dependent dehydrogenase (short-subunit alcohol dehydrogenase family)